MDASISRTDPSRERFGARLRGRLLAGDLDRLLAEHQAAPLGPHGDDLARLLAYVRGAETNGKLVIYALVRDRRWALARIGEVGRSEGSLEVDASQTYGSLAEAEHAALLARVAALREAGAKASA